MTDAAMTDTSTYECKDFVLQCGITLPVARLVYKTYGTLADDKSNVILYPTSYSAQHSDIDWLIGKDRILDPTRYFIIIPNMMTNGLSTSPSNTPYPLNQGRFPDITIYDNVLLQRRFLNEVFGIERLAMVYGWSMGGQQAYHWGALFPDDVDRLLITCSSARTSEHNKIFLDSIRAALTADPAWRDGWFHEQPVKGIRAMGRIYAGWAISQTFYRQQLYKSLGYTTLEDFLVRFWEWTYSRRDANDLHAQLGTWFNSDISANELYKGDLAAALSAIKAKVLLMPGETDLYFRTEDNELELPHLKNAELRPIPSIWGHRAGNPSQNPEDERFIAQGVRDLLSA